MTIHGVLGARGLEGALLATLGTEDLTFSWTEDEDVEGEYWEG